MCCVCTCVGFRSQIAWILGIFSEKWLGNIKKRRKEREADRVFIIKMCREKKHQTERKKGGGQCNYHRNILLSKERNRE